MRIAQLANFVGPRSGGMKTAVHALGNGYVASGARRLLVVPGSRDERISTSAGEVFRLRAPRFRGGYRVILEPWRVIEILEDFAPTTVEISDKSSLLPISGWARRNDVGSVLLSHERLGSMLSLRTGWRTAGGRPVAALNRLLMRQFDAVVVTSGYARREFAAGVTEARARLHQIPLGVDLGTFRPADPATASIEPEPGRRPLRLVHAGRLSREKTPHLAVAAAMVLHARGVPVRLDVYGEGPQRAELERLAAGRPIFFHGHVPGRAALSARLARADIALSVCPGETFGLSVLEALASGTPVVTADTGGARELVDASCGAWAAPVPDAIADAVLELATRPVAGRRTAARHRAEQYPWESTVDSMLELHAGLGGAAADLSASA
jgi:alpha-1,6-mannosyltransferase